MSKIFDQRNPPKAGISKLLWDWFTKQEFRGKSIREEPDGLDYRSVGHWQASQGACAYIVYFNKEEYSIQNANEVKEIIKNGYQIAYDEGGQGINLIASLR